MGAISWFVNDCSVVGAKLSSFCIEHLKVEWGSFKLRVVAALGKNVPSGRGVN